MAQSVAFQRDLSSERWTFWNPTRANTGFCTWGGINPGTGTGWERPAGGQLCVEGPGVCEPAVCFCSQAGPGYPGLNLYGHCQQVKGGDPPPQCWWSLTWNTVSSSGLHSTQQAWSSWSQACRELSRAWNISLMRISWGICPCWASRRDRWDELHQCPWVSEQRVSRGWMQALLSSA